MRMMMRVRLPVEMGNRAVKANKLGPTIQAILAEQKPEAVYFGTDCGQRTAFIFLNLKENADVPKLAEPWFLAFNATVDLQPVMVPEDLAKAGPAIEEAARKYA
jgi:hypothetical protein